ncbi:SidA/IucD/PvdA family monooxygenase [Corynebacterium sp. zg254]|uniref:L-lysine N6-monooxygenase MbtG n=1 Tax=Corynebacterium zhongnanshanii TaxID=2768834 RepID=A0ABQ6VGB6_9CORY|nr:MULTISPECIES: SidA/IucD/PvdA family monooxygenase [Corynebacterium]KAB3522843.1 lysine N(6)-hydroxylase/L-ornithine N(5)-oxygenase family protein [Corynebacterium zhongnanshanii]MCR5914087.1 SidA/IucD/PvdA family monooxygenase [Corynebacterium sp. zg254]
MTTIDRLAQTNNEQPVQDSSVYDVVGIGIGPGNLGLAVAIEEEAPELTSLFLEARPEFNWHPGMLLDGANMQISFLKDLVTVRNPQSRFSFINYLHHRGRLMAFINRQTFTPERVEFADYLRWIADNISAKTQYNTTVTSVETLAKPAADGARFIVHAESETAYREDEEFQSGSAIAIRCRNVVVARGLESKMPSWAEKNSVESKRIFHNIDLVPRIRELQDRGVEIRRAIVIGAGQSAAEVIRYFHDRPGVDTVTGVLNSYGFIPADDSPFANQVFDPAAVDDFFHAPDAVRAELLIRHRYTNYACVELELLEELYGRQYRENVTGNKRLDIRRTTEVLGVRNCADGSVDVDIQDRVSGNTVTENFDVVVCATGFRSRGLTGIHSGTGDISVTRDYSVVCNGQRVPGLFVQGDTEATHGLGSTLLSNIATRSGELVAAITGEDSGQRMGAAAERNNRINQEASSNLIVG